MADPEDDQEKVETDEAGPIPDNLDFSGEVDPVIGGDPPEWFSDADAQIMFILYTGLTLTPSILAENTEFSRQTVSKRLNTLQAAGFVEKVSRGKYKITKEGAFVTSGDPDIYRDNNSNNNFDEES